MMVYWIITAYAVMITAIVSFCIERRDLVNYFREGFPHPKEVYDALVANFHVFTPRCMLTTFLLFLSGIGLASYSSGVGSLQKGDLYFALASLGTSILVWLFVRQFDTIEAFLKHRREQAGLTITYERGQVLSKEKVYGEHGKKFQVTLVATSGGVTHSYEVEQTVWAKLKVKQRVQLVFAQGLGYDPSVAQTFIRESPEEETAKDASRVAS